MTTLYAATAAASDTKIDGWGWIGIGIFLFFLFIVWKD